MGCQRTERVGEIFEKLDRKTWSLEELGGFLTAYWSAPKQRRCLRNAVNVFLIAVTPISICQANMVSKFKSNKVLLCLRQTAISFELTEEMLHLCRKDKK